MKTNPARIQALRDSLGSCDSYTVTEAALALGVSRNFLYEEIRAGRLVAHTLIGRKRSYRLTVEDIKDWHQRRTEVVNIR